MAKVIKTDLIHKEKYLNHDLEIYNGTPKDKDFKVVIRRYGKIIKTGSILRKKKHSLLGGKQHDFARKMVRTCIHSQKERLKKAIKEIVWERGAKLEITEYNRGFIIRITQDTTTKTIRYELFEGKTLMWDAKEDKASVKEILDRLRNSVKDAIRFRKMRLWATIGDIERERREKEEA